MKEHYYTFSLLPDPGVEGTRYYIEDTGKTFFWGLLPGETQMSYIEDLGRSVSTQNPRVLQGNKP